MTASPWTIRKLRSALADGDLKPTELAELALAHCSRNPSRNTYLWQDAAWTRAEAARAEATPRVNGGPFGDGRSALWGLPVSVKDCFDLGGAPTSCGVRFYRDLNGIAAQDSWLVEQLRGAGAVIIGKTHLHPLAYGITGENPEFADCLLPGDAGALTGGSSSGAVASVLEGSAVAAIGTDTGGSVRAPAALGGLAGYRATLGRGDWRGGLHLAESFDTMGWLFRDLEDAPLLAGIFAPAASVSHVGFTRFAAVADSFLDDCEPEILAGFHATIRELESLGLEGSTIDPSWWAESLRFLRRSRHGRRRACTQATLTASSLLFASGWSVVRASRQMKLPSCANVALAFNARMEELFAEHQLILLPCAPVARLAAGADHSQTRGRLLRYTTPFSLAGVPAVAIPCAAGGMQLAAAAGLDEPLLELAGRVGAQRNAAVETRRVG